jgi:hypothetical protein
MSVFLRLHRLLLIDFWPQSFIKPWHAEIGVLRERNCSRGRAGNIDDIENA